MSEKLGGSADLGDWAKTESRLRRFGGEITKQRERVAAVEEEEKPTGGRGRFLGENRGMRGDVLRGKNELRDRFGVRRELEEEENQLSRGVG